MIYLNKAGENSVSVTKWSKLYAIKIVYHEDVDRKFATFLTLLLEYDGVGILEKNKILLGVGGGHYVPRHMDIVL